MKNGRISISVTDDLRVVFHVPVNRNTVSGGLRSTVVFSFSRRQWNNIVRKTSPEALKTKPAKRGK